MADILRPEDMVKGKKYEIKFMIRGVQRYPRKSVMVYLGINETTLGIPQRYGVGYLFSARPAAGTQEIARDHILEVKEVPRSTPSSINERA
jgi:hypothetical protein